MREPEGIETPLPGKSSERTWSKRREPYFRIVEVGGSSPLTSTLHLVGSPRGRRTETCAMLARSHSTSSAPS